MARCKSLAPAPLRFRNCLPVALAALLSASALASATPTAAALGNCTFPLNYDYLDDVPVWRIRLVVRTADGENSGTDDPAYVQLNGTHDKFWLDYGGNDRERNSHQVYDVLDPDVVTAGDIAMIKIGKSGNDGWGISSVELWINADTQPIYRSSGSSVFLDSSSGYSNSVILSNLFHYADEWELRDEQCAIPEELGRESLESIIEASLGDSLHHDGSFGVSKSTYSYHADVYWKQLGEEAVTVTRRSDSTHDLDLDLGMKVTYDSFITSPGSDTTNLDVDLKLTWSCSDGSIEVTPNLQDVDFHVELSGLAGVVSDILGLFGFDVDDYLENVVESKLQSRLRNSFDGLNVDLGGYLHGCSVDDDGNLQLDWF
ncbi:MAG: hypothetical protein HYV63_24620 [Candidatus Schekmanbacteria bacterium]|nr:hypothetical protein [Candidatus Schekmanbacteria bacterium]